MKSALPDFFKDGDARRTVAAWELLATIVAFKLFGAIGLDSEFKAVAVARGITDNQGNPYAVGRMMSTRFPMNVLVMELATTLELAGTWLDLKWQPRDENRYADALTNELFEVFDRTRRVSIDINRASFPTMFRMLESGKSLFDSVAQAKVANKKRPRIWPRIAKEKRLRATDPW